MSATLAGLDDVPWASLQHAYGSAEDVPALLRAIADGTGSASPLFSNLWHQGTVYSATAPAVPFLAELVEHAAPADASLLLDLARLMAGGHGYLQVHQGLLGAPPDLAETLAREAAEVGAAHAAVCREAERWAAFLGRAEAEVRVEAARLVGALSGVGRRALRWLVARLPAEADPAVRRAILDGLGHLAAATPAREAARLDPAAWPDPLDEGGRAEALHLLGAAALGAATPGERVVAADWRGALGAPVDRDPAALVADLIASGDVHDERDVFAWSPALRLAATVGRIRAGQAGRSDLDELEEAAMGLSSPQGLQAHGGVGESRPSRLLVACDNK